MLYMELAVGQFTGRGPIGALGHLCPLFKGSLALSLIPYVINHLKYNQTVYISEVIVNAIFQELD